MTLSENFLALAEPHREQILAAFFQSQHPNFSKKQVGLDIDVPAGYSVRVAVILTCELPNEIVKKIFVLQQDSNDFMTRLDVEEFSEYAAQLKETGVFVPERDDLWVITPNKWEFSAFNNKRGRIVFSSIDDIIRGIDQKYGTDRELRDVLRHYGIIRQG